MLASDLHVLYHRLCSIPILVYNVEVEGSHEYYANGILVHNCDFCISNSSQGAILMSDSFASGAQKPPAHVNCYKKGTKVMTEEGWKNVESLSLLDRCLSLNPKTQELEYVKVSKKVETGFVDKLLRFSNNNYEVEVTSNHQMIYQTDWDSKKNKERFKFCDAKDLPTVGRIPRGGDWKGSVIDYINIGKHAFSMESFCEFMGYYLSEGSVTKRSDNWYQIQISQSKSKYYEDVVRVVEQIGLRSYKSEEYVGINDVDLGIYLKKFGKSFEKFIPQEIKNSSKKNIRLFLDCYLKGDGNVQKSLFEGYEVESVKYTTSSEKMSSDLCELIVKVGKRPSVHLQKMKGKKVSFSNGDYVCNHDIFIVGERKGLFTRIESLKREEVEYKDKAYCVELERNHTLYVMSNGKCSFSGNCNCWVFYTYKTPRITKSVLDSGFSIQEFTTANPYSIFNGKEYVGKDGDIVYHINSIGNKVDEVDKLLSIRKDGKVIIDRIADSVVRKYPKNSEVWDSRKKFEDETGERVSVIEWKVTRARVLLSDYGFNQIMNHYNKQNKFKAIHPELLVEYKGIKKPKKKDWGVKFPEGFNEMNNKEAEEKLTDLGYKTVEEGYDPKTLLGLVYVDPEFIPKKYLLQ